MQSVLASRSVAELRVISDFLADSVNSSEARS